MLTRFSHHIEDAGPHSGHALVLCEPRHPFRGGSLDELASGSGSHKVRRSLPHLLDPLRLVEVRRLRPGWQHAASVCRARQDRREEQLKSTTLLFSSIIILQRFAQSLFLPVRYFVLLLGFLFG